MELIKNSIKNLIDRTPILNNFILFKGKNVKNKIALTFDDGPSPENTPRLLDLLNEKNIKVTFFLLGTQVEKYPELAKAILRNGHAIGNHSYSHREFDELSNEEALFEIQRGFEVLQNVLNIDGIFLLRPPKGDIRWRLLPSLIKKNFCIVFWSVDPKDFEVKKPIIIWNRLLQYKYKGGEIILLHDTVDATIDIIGEFIDTMQRKGFHFVTIPELCPKREIF